MYDHDEIPQDAAESARPSGGHRPAVRRGESHDDVLFPSDPGREIAEHVRMILAERAAARETGEPENVEEDFANDFDDSIDERAEPEWPAEQKLSEPDGTGRQTGQNRTEPDEIGHGFEAHRTKPDETGHLDRTEPDETGQNRTDFENENVVREFFPELSPRKQTAIRHLVEGANITETAKRIGVRRQTVSEWLHHNFEFEMALREKLREVWGETNVGMASHAQKAINKLVGALDYRDPAYHLSAARFLLSLTPLARGRSPVGPYLPWGG